jgi:hypothetical protein
MTKLTVSHMPSSVYIMSPRFTCGDLVDVKALDVFGFVSRDFRRVLSACPAVDALRKINDTSLLWIYAFLFGGLLTTVLAVSALIIPEVGERKSISEDFTFAFFGGLLLFGIGTLLIRDSAKQFRRMVEIYNEAFADTARTF